MTLLTTLKAGLVAAALGVGALAAAPAQAAPPNFSFSFDFGNGGGPGMYFDYGGKPKFMCLSDRQIVWQLRSYGFKGIQIWKSKGYNVIVVARWHGDWYQLLINRCSGKIVRKPMQYRGDVFGGNFGGPGFGITLSF
jgi:hypothetical protein